MGERVLCKHEVVGSIPSGSTKVLTDAPTFELEVRPESFRCD